MPVAAPALLFKLWIAKKLAVLLAIRAFGVKRLYRRGVKTTEYAFGKQSWSSTRLVAGLRATCSAAMTTEAFVARRASAFVEGVMTQAGFSTKGMPSFGKANVGKTSSGATGTTTGTGTTAGTTTTTRGEKGTSS